MATLHVRNVPDDLYELLRERAAENDRSIGAETVQLLQEHLLATTTARTLRRLRRRPAGSGHFTRFTPLARQAVVAAQEEARGLGHDHVGTEHLLLGVLAQTPELVDLSPEDVRAQLEPGTTAEPTGQIPFTPTAKQALELALRAALTSGAVAIEPRHLLVGITSTDSRGCELLRGAKVDVLQLPHEPDPAFRVVLLEGDAESWEKQLNDAAVLGYELVEIVDRRAILRR